MLPPGSRNWQLIFPNKPVHFANPAWSIHALGSPAFFASAVRYNHKMFMKLKKKKQVPGSSSFLSSPLWICQNKLERFSSGKFFQPSFMFFHKVWCFNGLHSVSSGLTLKVLARAELNLMGKNLKVV